MKPMKIAKTILPDDPIKTVELWRTWVKIQNRNRDQKNRFFNPKHDAHDHKS